MKIEYVVLKCEHCGEMNRFDTSMPAQGCLKCGKKIIIPQGERKIKEEILL